MNISLLLGFLLASGAADGLDLRPVRLAADSGVEQEGDGSLLAAARRRTRRSPPRVNKEKPAPEAVAPAPPEGGEVPVGGPPGRTSRIEFEGMQIKGQTTKAGEVQILERRDSEMKSMVKRRTSYREEIIKSVFPVTP